MMTNTGAGLINIPDESQGVWIPIGFWYTSKQILKTSSVSSTTSSIQCFIFNEKDKSISKMCVSLRSVLNNIKCVKLTKIIQEKYEIEFIKTVYSYFTKQSKLNSETFMESIVSVLSTVFSNRRRGVSFKKTHSQLIDEKLKTINMYISEIDKPVDIDKIHLTSIESTFSKYLDNSDFNSFLNRVSEIEKQYFEDYKTYF